MAPAKRGGRYAYSASAVPPYSEDAKDKAKRLRVRILRFADELLQGEPHIQEHFNEILEDITEYNRYCSTHPDFPNDKAAISIGHIENVYRARLENNDFL